MRKEYKYESKFSDWVCKNIHGVGTFIWGKVFGKKLYLIVKGRIRLGSIKTVRFVVKKMGGEKL